MGASHSVSWDASAGRSSREGPVLVITADALKQLTNQIREQKGEEVHEEVRTAIPLADDSEDKQRKRQEVATLERFWSNRLEVYKKQNEELKQKLDSLNQVEFLLPAPKLAPKLTDPPSERQQKLEQCLKLNSQQPLKCCREVKDFVKAVSDT